MMPIVGLVVALVLLLLLASFAASIYRKCPPNTAMLISGMGASDQFQGFKIVVGGGAVVLPLVQQANYISLAVQRLEISPEKPFASKSGEQISMTLVAEVKIKGEVESIAAAAERLLGKSEDEVARVTTDALLSHSRAMVGTLELRELLQSLDRFAQSVQECAIIDLGKFGLTIDALHIMNVETIAGSAASGSSLASGE